MRTTSTLLGLTLLALTGSARAEEAAAATAPASAEASPLPPPAANVAAAPAVVAAQPVHRKLEVSLAFLPMALGKFTSSPGGTPKTVDARFAYGAALSVSYEVLEGLFVGLAPQYSFNVGDKSSLSPAKELDILVRLAYVYRPAEGIAVYAEVLPGYSLIYPAKGDPAKGMVLVVGAGSVIDITDRVFANLGVGYQLGFQNRTEETTQLETRTKYVRVTLGAGMRF
jgi:hypothetical protein